MHTRRHRGTVVSVRATARRPGGSGDAARGRQRRGRGGRTLRRRRRRRPRQRLPGRDLRRPARRPARPGRHRPELLDRVDHLRYPRRGDRLPDGDGDLPTDPLGLRARGHRGFGVDRNATYEGERRVDDSATESVESFSKDADARGAYERNYGQYGRLSTTDWAYVERLRVEWYDPDEFGAPLEVRHGDRFVSAQRGCLDNPDAAGWYRFASVTTGEFDNGTEVSQDRPTFSHWFYVCDCASREAAVETLGPPPSEADDGGGDEHATATPTPDGPTMPTATATDAGGPVDAEGASATGSRTADGTPTHATATADPTGTRTAAAGSTPTAGWDDWVIRTPTAADGAGLTPVAPLLATIAGLALLRRR